MILNVSSRTDIVAFYTPWFLNRLKEGFVDVRNPFYEKQVSRIYFSDVEAILFCTKNPIPIIKFLKNINKPILFHITLTSYGKDIEPNVPPKGKIIEAIKKTSEIIGKDNLYIRYDPIFISEKYTIEYHIKNFEKLCNYLDGYIEHIIISFLDEYKNVHNNYKYLKYKKLNESDINEIGLNFGKIANEHNIKIQTCFEVVDLTKYGFIKEECLSKEIAYRLTGRKNHKKWNARKCNCVEMVDIGYYNTCHHLCKYCYANYEEKKVLENKNKHNPNSSLLIGELKNDDIIKIRSDNSVRLK